MALAAAALLVGLALAAEPGGKEDPLATISYVGRYAQFSRVECAARRSLRLGTGAELVTAKDGRLWLKYRQQQRYRTPQRNRYTRYWDEKLTFLTADGWVEIGGQRIDVTGQAWLDREWSSQFLQPDQQGWD